MEGFRAALTPLDPRVVAARPQPGQGWSAAGLRALLAGGSLTEPGAARRLQDPLSFRCASQLHGSLHAALGLLANALEPELNGAADNPLVLADDGEILSTGNFQVPALALALDAVAIGIAQVASAIAERQNRLKVTRLSGLPRGLVARARLGPDAHRSGGVDQDRPVARARDPAPRRAGRDPLDRVVRGRGRLDRGRAGSAAADRAADPPAVADRDRADRRGPGDRAGGARPARCRHRRGAALRPRGRQHRDRGSRARPRRGSSRAHDPAGDALRGRVQDAVATAAEMRP